LVPGGGRPLVALPTTGRACSFIRYLGDLRPDTIDVHFLPQFRAFFVMFVCLFACPVIASSVVCVGVLFDLVSWVQYLVLCCR
jgi:hypothetical protein